MAVHDASRTTVPQRAPHARRGDPESTGRFPSAALKIASAVVPPGEPGEIPTMPWLRLTATLAGRAVRSPSLAVALVTVVWRFRRRGWYTRFPFLPMPSKPYLAWRMYTAYGSEDAIPPADDVERYARWAARAR